jgi:hypothetical protein
MAPLFQIPYRIPTSMKMENPEEIAEVEAVEAENMNPASATHNKKTEEQIQEITKSKLHENCKTLSEEKAVELSKYLKNGTLTIKETQKGKSYLINFTTLLDSNMKLGDTKVSNVP